MARFRSAGCTSAQIKVSNELIAVSALREKDKFSSKLISDPTKRRTRDVGVHNAQQVKRSASD